MAIEAAEVLETLVENADWEETSSVPKARAFVTAAKRYLILSPASQSDQGSSLTLSIAQIQQMMQHASAFVAANTTTGNASAVRFLGVGTSFR